MRRQRVCRQIFLDPPDRQAILECPGNHRELRPCRCFPSERTSAVQSFVLKLVNNNSPRLTARLEGPRLDSRVNLVLVVLIVPVRRIGPRPAGHLRP